MGINRYLGLSFVLIVSASFESINSAKLGQADKSVQISKHPVIIVISYDGFRYDYLEKTETPNLTRMKKDGVSVPYMMNQFLTNTFPNHHSIATGRYIESHGVVANTFYDPLYGYLSGFHDDPGFWKYSPTVLPLWVVNELAGDGCVSGAMMWPGSNEPFGPENTYATYRKKYEKSYPFEKRIDDVISWITNEEKPANLVFLYCEEPDTTGQKDGPNGEKMIQSIKEMDDRTGYLLAKLADLGIEDNVNLIFLSDHGMQELSEEKEIDIVSLADPALYDNHRSSPVLQILPKDKSTTVDLYNQFRMAAEVHNNSFEVLLKDDIKKLKPHWHYEDNRRIMPILLVAKLGYTFVDSRRPSPRGPLFKVNTTEEPFENIDIYPLICHILEIEPPPNNGSLKNTLPLLKSDRRTTTSSGNFFKGYKWIGVIAGAVVGAVIISAVLIFVKHRQRLQSMKVSQTG